MLSRLFPVLACVLTLSACNPNRRPPLDPAKLQTPAAEAVLRYVLEHCPRKAEAKEAVLGLGDLLAEPMPSFVEKFKDVPGLEFVPHKRVVAAMVDGKSRRFDQTTNEPVLELQISTLSDPKEGVQEAVAAWAFKDDAERFRLEVKEKAGGGYEIRELEKIPVPKRNDDRKDPGKK